ncbi:MAG TPA: hypothetical protein V6C91_07050, partial [Coleofasciculaceae cyanobacterium]
FGECHLKASHLIVARQLMVMLNNEGAESVRLYSASKITIDDLDRSILVNGINIASVEKDQYNRLLLICPTDSLGWCVVYQSPDLDYFADAFRQPINELRCDALFGAFSEKDFSWVWASYQKGELIDECSYFGRLNQWYRMGEKGLQSGEPPSELLIFRIFPVYGRTFTKNKLLWVLYRISDLPLVERAQYKLIVATNKLFQIA